MIGFLKQLVIGHKEKWSDDMLIIEVNIFLQIIFLLISLVAESAYTIGLEPYIFTKYKF